MEEKQGKGEGKRRRRRREEKWRREERRGQESSGEQCLVGEKNHPVLMSRSKRATLN